MNYTGGPSISGCRPVLPLYPTHHFCQYLLGIFITFTNSSLFCRAFSTNSRGPSQSGLRPPAPGLNLSVTADAVPPPLPRGGFGRAENFSSSPEAPLLGELSSEARLRGCTKTKPDRKPLLGSTSPSRLTPCHCPGCGSQRLLRCRSHPAGRGPNSDSLFPPLAAVVVVAPKGRGFGYSVRLRLFAQGSPFGRGFARRSGFSSRGHFHEEDYCCQEFLYAWHCPQTSP